MRTLTKRLFLIPALVALHSGAQTFTTYSTLGEPGDIYNFSSAWLVNGSANPPEPYVERPLPLHPPHRVTWPSSISPFPQATAIWQATSPHYHRRQQQQPKPSHRRLGKVSQCSLPRPIWLRQSPRLTDLGRQPIAPGWQHVLALYRARRPQRRYRGESKQPGRAGRAGAGVFSLRMVRQGRPDHLRLRRRGDCCARTFHHRAGRSWLCCADLPAGPRLSIQLRQAAQDEGVIRRDLFPRTCPQIAPITQMGIAGTKKQRIGAGEFGNDWVRWLLSAQRKQELRCVIIKDAFQAGSGQCQELTGFHSYQYANIKTRF